MCIIFFPSTSKCIAEAKAVVVGPTDIYVKMGSEVMLTCIVSQGPHELGTIYWYRGKHFGREVNFFPFSNQIHSTDTENIREILMKFALIVIVVVSFPVNVN